MALYRKYRPQTFAEVIGQEHVTEPLISAINNGRLNHAYLFSGPRGCGKTSSARILARSLNCAKGPTATPCDECESCRALAIGGPGSIDVIEIDAASHGGVDDARELRERAVFAPVNSRFKIYVIDEAHMVSSAGFNALLKLVEEPPDYVMFVFATTEPEKVLPTIRSRTHHYPFRLVPPAAMRGLCERLCEAEGVTIAPEVYPLVIRAGGGSARDTLSVLDQLIAGAGPEGVTYQHAISLLGVTDGGLLDGMCDALANMDGSAGLAAIDQVLEAGHDPRRFATDLLERLRDLIVLNQVPDAKAQGLIDAPAEVLERMTGQALRLGTATLSRMAEIVHDTLSAMRGTTAPRLLLELAVARAVLPAVDDTASGLLQRIEQLERGAVAVPSAAAVAAAPAAPVAPAPSAPVAAPSVPEPKVAPPPTATAPPAAPPSSAPPVAAAPVAPPAATPPAAPPVTPVSAAPPTPPAPAATGDGAPTLSTVRNQWEQIKQAARTRKKTVAAYLMEASVTQVTGSEMVLTFKHQFHANALQSDAAMRVFTEAMAEVVGGKWRVTCEVGDPSGARPSGPAAPPAAAPPTPPAVSAGPAAPPPPAAAPPPAVPRPAPTPPTRPSTIDEPPWPEEAPFDEDEPPPAPPQATSGPRALSMDQAVTMFANKVGARKL
ncbi:DNA polymerase III subunit gamma and tau [Stackebrandtia endophytica]|uniref:DNA polymerase III subunit gamma and tau n=1 Tax=Stackebrandtia endophytica TaxID=1496996 RepID=UPI00115235CD